MAMMRRRRLHPPPASESFSDSMSSKKVDFVFDVASISSSCAASERQHAVHQRQIPTYCAFLALTFLALLYGGVYLLDQSLPAPYMLSDEVTYPDEFIAERAQSFLKRLTDLGPRVVGSQANELHAPQLIRKEIEAIIASDAHQSLIGRIHISHQTVTGCYALDLMNCYASVQNIVVKIDGKQPQNDSILINAHFDSVPSSPGASDDGIMVAVMLETFRKLVRHADGYSRDVIFLFNGAEESHLQAAHGFITQHPWASSCSLIVNLEAAGHGGKAIMFQSGPKGSSSLMAHYVGVPYPYGHAAGEEIFQYDLIPSDTDFRIFRDFGGLSGFDFAFAQNGYRYHTRFDSFGDLPLGSYQQAGGNLLALVRSLADADTIDDAEQDYLIYFDVFNWFIVHYSLPAAYAINIIVAIASFAVAAFAMPRLQLHWNKADVWYLVILTVVILISWVIAGAVALFVALLIDIAGNTMSWYGTPLIIFGLYVAPILGIFMLVMYFFNRFANHNDRHLGQQSQIQMHVVCLIWSVILLIGTLMSIRSVYIVMLPVLFNTLGSLLVLLLKWNNSDRKWQVTMFIFNLIPSILTMYIAVEVFELFVPIAGRQGTASNPEFFIAGLTLIVLLLIASYYVPFTALVHKQHWIIITLFLGFGVAFLITIAGGCFPYYYDKDHPMPQRFTVYHTNRVHHSYGSNQTETLSGIYFANADRNSPKSVRSYINLERAVDLSQDAEKYPACGMPVSRQSALETAPESTWLPFEPAVINNKTVEMDYTRNELNANQLWYQFTIRGPDHMTVFLRSKPGCAAVMTNSPNLHTEFKDNYVFINHVYGAQKDLEFSVEVECSEVANGRAIIDLAISAYYYNLETDVTMTKNFKQFVDLFPDWAHVAPVVAHYGSYQL